MTPLAWLFIFILLILSVSLLVLGIQLLFKGDGKPKPKTIFEKSVYNWNNPASPHFVITVVDRGFDFETIMQMALTEDSPPLPYTVISKRWSDKHYAIAQASEWVASASMGADWIKAKVYASPQLSEFVDGSFELNVFAKKVLDNG